MTHARITIWGGDGATKAYNDPKTRLMLDEAQPPYITLHADPTALASVMGAALTHRVMIDYPTSRVWWAIQGDSYGPDPSNVWVRCAKAAVDAGVSTLEANCESAWIKSKRPFGTARRAILAVHEAAPGLVLGHTSFDGPVNYVYGTVLGFKKRWGYGQSYDWAGFLGDGSPVAWSAAQVYAATMIGQASRAALLTRLDRHHASWAIAQHIGLIRPGLERHIYLQSHHSNVSGLVTLAESAPVAAWWCTPNRLDPAGRLAILAICELERRHQTVKQFQASAGLAADGIAGPLTLTALGVIKDPNAQMRVAA